MDISFETGNEKFNYRACAIILNDGRILAMHDERSPYYYLYPEVVSNWEKGQRMPSSVK